jgi:hypothetical protein
MNYVPTHLHFKILIKKLNEANIWKQRAQERKQYKEITEQAKTHKEL